MKLLQNNVLGGNKLNCFKAMPSVRGFYTNIDWGSKIAKGPKGGTWSFGITRGPKF